ncbi:MAG: RNB domain-containing ribonuclease [Victivallaceae bacterium]|nr:RNB domain-containing ribonuclease [Victivallaceae bacterium]
MIPQLIPGALVAYRDKAAVITGKSGAKLDLILENGGSMKVRPKDVIFLHPGPAANPAGLTAPIPVPELDETLEMLAGETVGLAELAALLFGEFTPGSAWNAYRLVREGKYFTGSPENGIGARPRAKIAAAEAEAAVKAEAAARRAEFIDRIRSGRLVPEDAKAMREIEKVAYGSGGSSAIMRELGIEATPEKAHALLLKTGIWTDQVNPWPARQEADLTIPDVPVPDLPAETRRDLTALPAFAIDDPDNQDPDDALSYDPGRDIFWVHVADVAALVKPNSELDLEARRRGVSLYLPERTVPMLPGAVTARLGLGLQDLSPAFSFAVRVAEDGTPELLEATASLVKVTRLTYAEADTRINDGIFAAMQAATRRFHERREANGAVIIDLPEVKIKIGNDGSISFMPIVSTPGRDLVTDAMLLCGEAAGRFAYDRGLSIPYTVQELPEGKISGGVTPAGMFARRKQLKPSQQSLLPGKHCGLGLEYYCRITSPLRRYSDLLAHQQFRAFIAGQPVLDAAALDACLAAADRPAALARRLERTVNEYWTLVHLSRHPDWEGDAIVLDNGGTKAAVLIPELAYLAKIHLHAGIELNTGLKLKLLRADPAGLTAAFKITGVYPVSSAFS